LVAEASQSDRALLGQPSRQPPLAVLFLAWRVIREIRIVNLIIIFALLSSGRLPTAVFPLLALIVIVVITMGLLNWWRFVFQVEGEDLSISKGVFAQERLVIPLSRVQSVLLEQGPLHRLTGLTRVALDTAGSSVIEFEIDALEQHKARALQRLTADYRRQAGVQDVPGVPPGFDLAQAPPPSGPPSSVAAPEPDTTTFPVASMGDQDVIEVLAQRRLGDLVRIGLTQWPWAGLLFLAPLLAVLDDLREFLGVEVLDNVEDAVNRDVSVGLVTLLFLFVLLLVLGAMFGLVLQIVREVLTNWDLRLSRTPRGLRRESGLFSRISIATSLDRIQAVDSSQLPMQRWLGIRRIVLHTVGESDLVVPGTTDDEFARIRELVFDGPDPVLDRRISRASVFLAARSSVVVAVASSAVLGFLTPLGWWGLLAFVIVPVQTLEAYRRWQLHRWGVRDGRLGQFTQFLTKSTEEMELVKAQSVSVRQSLFQRRRELASVSVKSAEGTLDVPMIPLDEACALRDLVLYNVETSPRSWM
jgi:putative membrane protein